MDLFVPDMHLNKPPNQTPSEFSNFSSSESKIPNCHELNTAELNIPPKIFPDKEKNMNLFDSSPKSESENSINLGSLFEDFCEVSSENIEKNLKIPEIPDNTVDPKIDEQEEPEAYIPQFVLREPSADDIEPPESQSLYYQMLNMYRVQMTEWTADNTSTYEYKNSDLAPEALHRINKELRAMTKSLPCESSGSIFLSIDSTNLGRMKVLISGPADTPYEHGLFLFNINIPEHYPSNPPEMSIKTTGNGTLRFNPNLYNTGFVCLSIINTWDGNPEEMWNPSFSTLMQVFLSIQSLVMDSDVLQKEPNYEHYETSSPDNQAYCTIVKYGNIAYAMLNMILSPPIEFKDVILKHFSLKKAEIIQTVEKWISELEDITNGVSNRIVSRHNLAVVNIFKEKPVKTAFEEIFEKLKGELDRLPQVN